MDDPRTIVAMGGGGFSMDPDTLLDDHILDTRSQAPRTDAATCLLPRHGVGRRRRLSRPFLRRVRASGGGLAPGPVRAHRDRYRRASFSIRTSIYVGGGNTANMLAIWRVHGVDGALRRAWEAGVVMTGLSAGSICWFEGGTTDSFGPLAALTDGLGFLPGTHSPHYDGEPARRPTYQDLVGRGVLAGGYAADDGAGARVQRHRPCRGRRIASRGARVSRRARSRRTRHRDGAADALSRLSLVDRESSVRGPGSHVPTGRTASGPSSESCLRRAVSTEQPQPGGTSPGAISASGARTNSRIAAAGCGTSRSRGALDGSRAASTDRAPSLRSIEIRARPKISRSRSSSRGPQRRRGRRPNRRSSAFSCSRTSRAPVAGSGPAGTSSAATALRNSP